MRKETFKEKEIIQNIFNKNVVFLEDAINYCENISSCLECPIIKFGIERRTDEEIGETLCCENFLIWGNLDVNRNRKNIF